MASKLASVGGSEEGMGFSYWGHMQVLTAWDFGGKAERNRWCGTCCRALKCGGRIIIRLMTVRLMLGTENIAPRSP